MINRILLLEFLCTLMSDEQFLPAKDIWIIILKLNILSKVPAWKLNWIFFLFQEGFTFEYRFLEDRDLNWWRNMTPVYDANWRASYDICDAITRVDIYDGPCQAFLPTHFTQQCWRISVGHEHTHSTHTQLSRDVCQSVVDPTSQKRKNKFSVILCQQQQQQQQWKIKISLCLQTNWFVF